MLSINRARTANSRPTGNTHHPEKKKEMEICCQPEDLLVDIHRRDEVDGLLDKSFRNILVIVNAKNEHPNALRR
jgi:hypothetical protein